MEQKTLEGTPTKLRNGSWGARIEGQGADEIRPGDTVTITTRAGKSWTAKVSQVVWRQSTLDVALVATVRTASKSRQSRSTVCADCGTRTATSRPLPDSSGVYGRCCWQCARMSRYERSYG